MGVIHLFSRIISSWFAFALPLFRSFQALQRRPMSASDVERLTKYWIVIAALLVYEYSVELLVSWSPFYWELKLLLLLFISLPHIQGSTYVYDAWLAPFLSRNELYIDHQIHLAENNFLGFFQSQVQSVFDRVSGQAQAHPGSTSNRDGDAGPVLSIQNAARLATGYLTAHGVTLAGKTDSTRPTSSRSISDASVPSGSSTAMRMNSPSEASRRSGLVSETQSPSLPMTPEDIHQAFSSMRPPNAPTLPPLPFPKPEHF